MYKLQIGIMNGKMKDENVDMDSDNESDGNNNSEGQEYTIRIPYFTVAQYEAGELDKFDEIIDVRTPLEFAEDRIPGAVNW